jgi:hypothetical protein
MQADVTSFQSAATANNTGGVEAACTQMVSDTTAAQASPDIPDTSLQAQYAAALADYHAGASECSIAVADQSTAQANQAGADFQSGNSALTTLGADFKQLANGG